MMETEFVAPSKDKTESAAMLRIAQSVFKETAETVKEYSVAMAKILG